MARRRTKAAIRRERLRNLAKARAALKRGSRHHRRAVFGIGSALPLPTLVRRRKRLTKIIKHRRARGR